MFIRGETLSAHSARPRKMPGWIVPVRENFSVNKRVSRKQTNENILRSFFLFQILHLAFTAFIKQKLKLIQLIFELASGRKFSGEQ